MNNLKSFFTVGTKACGLIVGIIFALVGLLLLTIGIWKMLLLVVLFAVGFLVGSVSGKKEKWQNIMEKIYQSNDK